MRFLLKISIPTEAGNAAIKDGTIPDAIQSILAEQKPESVYFTNMWGQRTALVFLDMENPSQMPALAEPYFLALKADVSFHQAMKLEDLLKAGPAIEKAVKKYGQAR